MGQGFSPALWLNESKPEGLPYIGLQLNLHNLVSRFGG
jgi:hypothetical protein